MRSFFLFQDNNGGFLHVQIKSEPISNNYDYQEEEEEEDDESEFPVSDNLSISNTLRPMSQTIFLRTIM
jgi:hypothetical protein